MLSQGEFEDTTKIELDILLLSSVKPVNYFFNEIDQSLLLEPANHWDPHKITYSEIEERILRLERNLA